MRTLAIIAVMLAISTSALADTRTEIALALAKAKHTQLRGCYCGGPCGAFCQCPDQGDCLGRWKESTDGFLYWHKNGKITHAHDPATGRYWKKNQSGQWIPWTDDDSQSQAPVQGVCRT